ncbi:lipopolysaccharide biosynthesis protein [Peribacillus butanolivorans]|uniref:lipopolysaccharide biosynthesis protein n=1 Tax=Peribacillus butanolivorans TaxID=421767 RepID=UPI00167F7737|nr:hypothetical protein [Peribacillus butanolivorans]QNU03884.1 hypothetical protein GM240_07970 [Peribacillus butanolivorans]
MNLKVNIFSKIKSLDTKNKSIINNVIASFIIQGGAIVVSLLTFPAYISYFDNQQILGLWFTILSVLTWVLTFDLGIGNGLRNHLVEPLVTNDLIKIKKYISSAYFIVGSMVVILLIASFIIFPFINWNTVFNISNEVISKDVILKSVTIVFFGIMLQFLLRLIASILYALQKSALPGLLTLFSSILTLLLVLTVDTGNIEENLILLSWINVVAVNLPLLVATLIIFNTKLKSNTPNIKFFNKIYAFRLIKLGGLFLWLQIMYMIISNTNEFLISWLSGPEYVVDYQIYNKLFTLVSTIFSLALTPIWSMVTKAMAENDFVWIGRLYKILKIAAVITILAQFLMIPFLQFIVDIWLGENIFTINYIYALIFAVAGGVFIWNSVISSIINGTGKIKIQFIFLTVGVIIKFPVAYFLSIAMGTWTAVIISNIVAMLPYCIIQPIWINKLIKQQKLGSE